MEKDTRLLGTVRYETAFSDHHLQHLEASLDCRLFVGQPSYNELWQRPRYSTGLLSTILLQHTVSRSDLGYGDDFELANRGSSNGDERQTLKVRGA